jgi:hypothetical protein
MSYHHIATETCNIVHFGFLLLAFSSSHCPAPGLHLFYERLGIYRKADYIAFAPCSGLKFPSIMYSREICIEDFGAVHTSGPSWVQLGKTCPGRACRRHGR